MFTGHVYIITPIASVFVSFFAIFLLTQIKAEVKDAKVIKWDIIQDVTITYSYIMKFNAPKQKPEMQILAWIPSTPVALVQGQSGKNYLVDHDAEKCTCPDFRKRKWHRCKHIMTVLSLVPMRQALEEIQQIRFAQDDLKLSHELESAGTEIFYCESCWEDKVGIPKYDGEITLCEECYTRIEDNVRQCQGDVYSP